MKQRVRTTAGTVHAHTIGRTYRQHGMTCTNLAGEVIGRTDCGSQTSDAATLTDEPLTCAKCAERA